MKSFFAGVWNSIQHVFDSAQHTLLISMEALIHSVATNGGAALVSAATAAVAAAEAQGGSGADKLNAAKAAVISSLTAQGVPIVMNAVNGAIEAAVADLNANKAAAAGQQPTN